MKTFAANCPACGGPVEFRISESLVTICEFCRSAVARTNKQVADHGKVADLFETRSPLALGVTGKFRDKSFEIVGRVQYQHPAGGVWNEWYLSFPGPMGWLAEAQGRFYLLFRKPARILGRRPDYETLAVGDRFDLGRDIGELVVTEKGVATAASAEGEIPWPFVPRAPHEFADLGGGNRVFGTIEFEKTRPPETESGSAEESPEEGTRHAVNVYLGREMTLAELGITARADEDKGVRRTTTEKVACPHCGGPLELIAPDSTERVGCPSCHSLLDNEYGHLKYLTTLKGKRVKPLIPLGKSGLIEGVSWTIIGFMERYVIELGKKYRWTEYLLYNAAHGFRWLVNSDDHWSFVSPIPPGEVRDGAREARALQQDFSLFQQGTAYVGYVVGEFYWRVEVGEQVATRDYIAPPLMLSFEQSVTGNSVEINTSVGRYMPHDEVEAAFGVTGLPRPWSVAPNQPPPAKWPILRLWGIFLLVLFGTYLLSSTGLFRSPPDGWLLWYGLIGVSLIPIGALVYGHSFERQRWSTSDYSPYDTGDDE